MIIKVEKISYILKVLRFGHGHKTHHKSFGGQVLTEPAGELAAFP